MCAESAAGEGPPLAPVRLLPDRSAYRADRCPGAVVPRTALCPALRRSVPHIRRAPIRCRKPPQCLQMPRRMCAESVARSFVARSLGYETSSSGPASLLSCGPRAINPPLRNSDCRRLHRTDSANIEIRGAWRLDAGFLHRRDRRWSFTNGAGVVGGRSALMCAGCHFWRAVENVELRHAGIVCVLELGKPVRGGRFLCLYFEESKEGSPERFTEGCRRTRQQRLLYLRHSDLSSETDASTAPELRIEPGRPRRHGCRA